LNNSTTAACIPGVIVKDSEWLRASSAWHHIASEPLGDAIVFDIIHYALGLVSLICFIYVVVKMFQNGSTVLGIVSIIGLCFCVGWLIAFVFGWIRSSQWNIRGLMLIWTVAIIAEIVMTFVHPSPMVGQFQDQIKQFQPK
jgi:hypothetical protein